MLVFAPRTACPRLQDPPWIVRLTSGAFAAAIENCWQRGDLWPINGTRRGTTVGVRRRIEMHLSNSPLGA
jgi:hypothetical protein